MKLLVFACAPWHFREPIRRGPRITLFPLYLFQYGLIQPLLNLFQDLVALNIEPPSMCQNSLRIAEQNRRIN